MRHGIPPSGPVDRFAFVVANRLVGNVDGAAARECTLIGPRFEVDAACAIAVTGADMPGTVNGAEARRWARVGVAAGGVVKLGAGRAGVRSSVACSGGLDVPPVLGSRSTYVRGRMGGLEGRALRKGDALSSLPSRPVRPRRVEPGAVPDYRSAPPIRLVLGPQDDRFTDARTRAR